MYSRFVKSALFVSVFIFGFSAMGQDSPKIGDVLYQPAESKIQGNQKVYTLLVTQFAYPNINYPIIDRTIEALKQLFGPDHLKVRVYSGETSDIGKADLVLSSAGTYARMKTIGARDLATVVSFENPDPNHAEGSTFIALKSRTDITDLASMKGKVVASTGPNAFSGYHVALGELLSQGYDPDHFFSRQVSTGHDMRDVLKYLRAGKADIGIVRTCFLEELDG